FSSVMSPLNSHGPVVKPRSPAFAIPANAGCQASNGFLSEGGTGCSSIHFLPLTAPGRNSKPSSAMNSMKASRVFFSAAVLENACSVFTMSCNADVFCAWTNVASIRNSSVARTNFILISSPENCQSNIPPDDKLNSIGRCRSQLLLATRSRESTHRSVSLLKVCRDSLPPTGRTFQTTRADKNLPSVLLCPVPHTRQSSRTPVLCYRCRCHVLVRQATIRPRPDAADAQRCPSGDYRQP